MQRIAEIGSNLDAIQQMTLNAFFFWFLVIASAFVELETRQQVFRQRLFHAPLNRDCFFAPP